MKLNNISNRINHIGIKFNKNDYLTIENLEQNLNVP